MPPMSRCQPLEDWDDQPTGYDVELRYQASGPHSGTFHVRVPGGGVVEACPLYGYEAPADGYEREWSASEPNARPHGTLFLRFRDGAYGRLAVRRVELFGEPLRMTLDYAVNLERGRELETPRRTAAGGEHCLVDHLLRADVVPDVLP